MKLHLTNALLWIKNSEMNWKIIHKMKGNIKREREQKENKNDENPKMCT